MKNVHENSNIASKSAELDMLLEIEAIQERKKYEMEFDSFQIGELIQEARKRLNMTQAQLAVRGGITKKLLSSIEKGESDIRQLTLKKIISVGLGGQIKLLIEV